MAISARDLAEIHALVARYCLTTDDADAEGFMECWVSPTEFGGYDSGAFGTMDTWEQLYAFEREHVGPGGGANGKRHQATNVLIEPDGEDAAWVTHDMIVLEVEQEPRVVATGRYDRSLVVRTPAGWRFKSRSLKVDGGFFRLMERMQADRAEPAR